MSLISQGKRDIVCQLNIVFSVCLNMVYLSKGHLKGSNPEVVSGTACVLC